MIFVFTGPTLSPEEGREHLDAHYLPPAAQGDILHLLPRNPWAIGIIDGYFEHVPAVWHKEILLAMSEGVHVYGASSMGALRAAELEPFGMVGIGKIFESYRDGETEDDDEVALVHGSAGDRFLACSEAMVNIRATLARARAEAVLDAEEHRRLIDLAKSLHYPLRDYPTVLAMAREQGIDPATLDRLKDWIPEHAVDRKREDAIALLQSLAGDFPGKPPPKQVTFTFQRTQIWENAVRQSGRRSAQATGPEARLELLLDELRLLGRETYHDRCAAVLQRVLAVAEAKRQGRSVSRTELETAANRFRLRHELIEPEEIGEWIDEQEIDKVAFTSLMEDSVRMDWIRSQYATEIQANWMSDLRAQDLYSPLSARVQQKQEALGASNLGARSLESVDASKEELLEWYFVDQLGQPAPYDLEHYATDLDLEGADVLLQLILREYRFQILQREADEEA